MVHDKNQYVKLMEQLLFKVSIVILITALTILPLFGMISTYYHEKAHINKAKEYGINFVYNFNFKNAYFSSLNPKPHPSGTSTPATKEDDIKYKNLDLKYKKDINLAGIRSDYNFIDAILSGIILTNLSLLSKKVRKTKLIYFVIYIDGLLFYWLWHIIASTSLNLFYPIGDLQKLFY